MTNISVQCPICKKSAIWSKENAHRPFCSARCKLIDLGEWANEQRRIISPSSTCEVLTEASLNVDKITIH